MQIQTSAISCGVYQLTEVGTDPTDAQYKEVLRQLENDGAVFDS